MKHVTIPLFSTEQHDFHALEPRYRFLGYSLQNIDTRQPRLQNRLVGIPQVKLADYRCCAVFDWVEIIVDLPKKTLAIEVAGVLKTALSHPNKGGVTVTDPAGQVGGYADQLLIRLQDPSLKRFEKMFTILGRRYHVPRSGRHIQHRVVDLELPVDFHLSSSLLPDDHDLILHRFRMRELLRKHIDHGRAQKDQVLDYRLQDKLGNERKKNDFQDLPLSDRRSRIVFGLNTKRFDGLTIAEELGIYTVSGIVDFNWQSLQEGFLSFELPTFSRGPDGRPNSDEIEVFKKAGCSGLKLFHQKRRDTLREYGIRDHNGRLLRRLDGNKGYNRTFSELNRKISKAMKAAGSSFAES